MKRIFLILMICLLAGCSKNPEELLPHLEGYWEIEKAIMQDGSIKTYEFNETIDYISFNENMKGFRKKLKPSFNNTYSTSESVEGLMIKIENDSLNLYYKTPFSSWKETVLNATVKELKIKNESNTTYIYKRYESLELDL